MTKLSITDGPSGFQLELDDRQVKGALGYELTQGVGEPPMVSILMRPAEALSFKADIPGVVVMMDMQTEAVRVLREQARQALELLQGIDFSVEDAEERDMAEDTIGGLTLALQMLNRLVPEA